MKGIPSLHYFGEPLRVWDDEPKRRRAHLDAVIIERITLDNRYYGYRDISKSLSENITRDCIVFAA